MNNGYPYYDGTQPNYNDDTYYQQRSEVMPPYNPSYQQPNYQPVSMQQTLLALAAILNQSNQAIKILAATMIKENEAHRNQINDMMNRYQEQERYYQDREEDLLDELYEARETYGRRERSTWGDIGDILYDIFG